MAAHTSALFPSLTLGRGTRFLAKLRAHALTCKQDPPPKTYGCQDHEQNCSKRVGKIPYHKECVTQGTRMMQNKPQTTNQ